ncbi:hypothetical protein SOVF_123830 [Spinacia oleracea]|uniref:Ubinuclein-1 n=1 Tax=Spinacia oleracea TaxID=3562 RepID=A0A9R0JP11_SPIOL|nr:ubinuclein-1-like [Spinacia oleracea]KNA12686.1 hypothetical protein SOVF_123830 [Spinacia oleracea]
MVEGSVAGESSSTASRAASSFVKVGDRTRFTVELRPGETTIVSWKKLMKDAAKAEGGAATATAATATAAAASTAVAATAAVAAPQPPPNSLTALESRLAPGQPAANELNDAPAPNRFSAVIEKIERLYTGKDSDDDENLDDIPDDDQYDTEDSFIDDAELDEYFEVDKSKTKHDGYFVNRGTLEKVNEPLESANQQPKKRRRKETAKDPGENGDGQLPNKHMKIGKKSAGKFASSADKVVLPTSQGASLKSSEDVNFQNKQKNIGDSKPSSDPSPSLRTSHGDTSSALGENNDKQKTGVLAKNPSTKLKAASENGDKTEYMHKSQSLKPNHMEESEVAQLKDKGGIRERIDLNLPVSKHTLQPMKNSVLHKKEGSSGKPKANLLEKAIRDLEKTVAEYRPPAPDAQDADSSGQCIKRRLPREIKQRLAKVSRLAHANNGNVTKELLNRLMGILGHCIQLRTLKRHLKLMMTMSLSVKEEKDDKFQQTKKEVIEMIKMRIPSMMSKAAEQQGGGSGDFQEGGHSEKEVKGQLIMDTTLEDKICDLYDIFVDGLDEDATPQVRKLYAELAELWPKGVMDNHGIKRAICRAKERKRKLNEMNKEHEKARRKKVAATNTEETVRVESSSAVQSQQYVDGRVVSDPTIAVVTQQNRISTMTSTAPATSAPISTTSMSIPSTNMPNFERLKQEKVKVTVIDGRPVDMGVKKKVKKRAENLMMGELPLRFEKPSSNQGDDRQKQHNKHTAGQLQNAAAHNKSSYNEFRFEPLT